MIKKVTIFQGNFSYGGAEVVGLNLANSFADMGIEVTMLCLKDKGDLRQRLSQKVKVVSLNTRLLFCLPALRSFVLSLDDKSIFISTIRNLNIAVSLAITSSNPRVKFIYREANTYRNYMQKGFKGKMTWLFYALVNNWAYSKAQVVIANSNDTKADLKKFSTKSILKKIIVIGNPISIKTNAINKVNNKFISNNIKGSPIILSVGRLHLQKDYFLALKVFRKLINNIPDAKYVILGDGNLLHELKNYSNFLGLSEGVNIFFEGTTLEPENFYMQSDLFLMTSKWEGFGNVVVEAMGYGVTPVVCKCPGGPRDIIGTEYGYYVNSRDPEIIAISLEHALKNKISKDTLSKRAFDFRSNYIAEQYLAVLK